MRRQLVMHGRCTAALVASSFLAATAALAQAPETPPPNPTPGEASAKPTPEEPKRRIKLSCRVKFDAIYDFGGLQTSDAFNITNIDTSPDRDENNRSTADVKRSRVRLDAVARETRLDDDVQGVVEGDFRGKGGSANYNLRVCEAFVAFAGGSK